MGERDLVRKPDRTDLTTPAPSTAPGGGGYDFVGEPPADDIGSHLWDYVSVVWRGRWLVLSLFVLCIGVAGFKALRAMPFYEAVAKIEVKRTPAPDPSRPDPVPLDSFIETQVEIIRGRTLAREVVEQLDLFAGQQEDQPAEKQSRSPAANLLPRIKRLVGAGTAAPPQEPRDPAEAQWSARIDAFLDCLDARRIGETQIVEVRFLATNPLVAAKAANALCDTYTSWSLRSKEASFEYARRRLADELVQAKTAWQKSEEKMREFTGGDRFLLLADSRAELSQGIMETEQELSLAERKQAQKEFEWKHADQTTTAARALTDEPRVQTLRAEIQAIDAQLAELQEEWQPGSTRVKGLVARKSALQTQLQEEIQGSVERVREEQRRFQQQKQLEYEQAKADSEFVKKKYDQDLEKLGALQKSLSELNVFQREADVNRDHYSTLLQQRKEFDYISRLQPLNVAVVERAEPPRAETPSMKRSMVFGSFVGLLLGVGLVLFLNYMDTTVKGPEEVERILRLPTLACIPHIKNGRWGVRSKTAPKLITHEQPQSPLAESFRFLRTSMLYSMAGRSPKTILIVSALAGEGKSTVAANLAVALAQKGKRVLLVDADLKRPVLHKCFGVDRSRGLSDLLTGKLDETIGCEPCDAFRKTAVHNLFLLPSGRGVPNPVDLIDSEMMRDLLALLGEEYEHIVIDSPPLTVRADALVLAPYVDGVLYVVQPGKTPRNVMRWVKEHVVAMQGRILGVVLNNPKRDLDQSRGFGYRYAYGYVHVYSDKEEGDQNDEDREQLAVARALGSKILPPERDNKG